MSERLEPSCPLLMRLRLTIMRLLALVLQRRVPAMRLAVAQAAPLGTLDAVVLVWFAQTSTGTSTLLAAGSRVIV